MNRGSNSGCPEINGISFMRLSVLTIHYIFKDPLRHDSKKNLTVHSKKKLVLYIPKSDFFWLVIIGEQILVLYSTKSWRFSGSSPVLWHN